MTTARPDPRMILALCAALFVAAPAAMALDPSSSDQTPESGTQSPCFAINRLNNGLPLLDDPPDLETPRSTLESFVDACDRGRYECAARCLNLNSIEDARQAIVGPELAGKLKFLLDRKIWYRWDDFPDRPDGLDDEAPKSQSTPDGPRRSLLVGSVTLDGRDVEVRLQRVRPPDGPAVWVFSRQTVDKIKPLYKAYGPGPFERKLPSFLTERHVGKLVLWVWIGLALLLVFAGAIGYAVERALSHVFKRLGSNWMLILGESLQGPLMLIVGLELFYYLSEKFLRLAVPIQAILDPILVASISVGVTWLLMRLVKFASILVSRRYEGIGGAEANSLITRAVVIRYLLVFLVFTVGTGVALSRFHWFRVFGMTVLASAGAVGAILGLAAHRSLGSLLAGIQLAFTQPVSAGDAVLFGADFGWVEEIAFTYIVIRTWDHRRMIVPIAYLIDNPIANWSKKSEKIIGQVYIYTDYRIDVPAVRAEFEKILEQSDQWDREVPAVLQVTNCKEETIELRALCSAPNPGASWELQCFVRERLIAFVQNLEDGRYLPRTRVVLEPDREAAVGNGHAHEPWSANAVAGDRQPKSWASMPQSSSALES